MTFDDAAKERQKLSQGRGAKNGPESLPDVKTGDARDQAGKARSFAAFRDGFPFTAKAPKHALLGGEKRKFGGSFNVALSRLKRLELFKPRGKLGVRSVLSLSALFAQLL